MAHNGRVHQFPAPWCQGGVGIIDSQVGEITFSVRELLNGGVEHLECGRHLNFELVNGRASDVYLHDVTTHHGTIEAYGDQRDTWTIKEDGTNLQVEMHYNRIFKGLPSIIAPPERVSYTRPPNGREALNIRFPDLVPLGGTITRYFTNGKGFVTPDGWNEDVIFHKAAFLYEQWPTIHIGMRVRFKLERACPVKLQKRGMHKAIQATRMKTEQAEIPEIQEVIHPDAPSDLPGVNHVGVADRSVSSADLESEALAEVEGLLDDDASNYSLTAERCSSTSDVSLQLVVLTFSRNPKPFHDVLQELMRSNDGIRLCGGAYLFAPAALHETIQAHVEARRLGCGNVIVTQDLEEPVRAAVELLPRKHKVSERSRLTMSMDLPDTWDELFEDVGKGQQPVEQMQQEVQPGEQIAYVVERTFIHVPVPSSLYSAISSGPRTNSDTTSMLLQNPRNHAPRNIASSSSF